MTKQKETYRELISRPEISFWVPILVSVITIALSWANMAQRIALLDQKLEALVAQNQTLVTKYGEVERRWGETSQRVTVLETKAGIK